MLYTVYILQGFGSNLLKISHLVKGKLNGVYLALPDKIIIYVIILICVLKILKF